MSTQANCTLKPNPQDRHIIHEGQYLHMSGVGVTKNPFHAWVGSPEKADLIAKRNGLENIVLVRSELHNGRIV